MSEASDPPQETAAGITRVAALGDLHCDKDSQGKLQPVFSRANQSADVLLLCGDLTDYGLPEETQILIKELAAVKIPVIAVLGNHDFESGHEAEVRKMLLDSGVRVLDGEVCEVAGVGFAGVKGYGGGFGRASLQPWGEKTTKLFVHEAVEESLKLESALAKLRTETRVVVMHYSPVQQTVEGEPPAIFAYLGSSRLEDPINHFRVDAVFHGHAHHGELEGRTETGVPVYNVAMPLLKRRFPEAPPFRVFEFKRSREEAVR